MDQIVKEYIEIIMTGKVENLVKLTDKDFDFVMAMLYAARYFHALEVKDKVKHGKKH